jgi:hypothetical protein
MSDALLRLAPVRAHIITIRFPRMPVTYILSLQPLQSSDTGVAACIHCARAPYVRSRCDPRWTVPLAFW